VTLQKKKFFLYKIVNLSIMPAEKESDAQLRVNDLQGDISFGSDDPINLPIQSITVEKSGQKVTQEQRVESPGMKHSA
jgi:hypothetical protein